MQNFFLAEIFSPSLNLTSQIPTIYISYLRILPLDLIGASLGIYLLHHVRLDNESLSDYTKLKLKSGCPSAVWQCAPPLFPFHRHLSQLDHHDQLPLSSQLSLVFPPRSRLLVFHPYCPREGMNTVRRNMSQNRDLPRQRWKHRSVTRSENQYPQAPLSMSVISSSMLERAMCNGSLKKPARWSRLGSSKTVEA